MKQGGAGTGGTAAATGGMSIQELQTKLFLQQRMNVAAAVLQHQKAAALQQLHQQAKAAAAASQKAKQAASQQTKQGANKHGKATLNTPLLHRSLSSPMSPNSNKHKAIHKLPTMAPTSPKHGGDLGRPQAKRAKLSNGASSPTGLKSKLASSGVMGRLSPGQIPPGSGAVNPMASYPNRPSSVPPQFPPAGPFVNGIMSPPVGMPQNHSPPGARPSPTQGMPSRPLPGMPNPMTGPPANGYQDHFINAFKSWCQKPNPHLTHAGPPPPPGVSPPAHMHPSPHPPVNGLSGTPPVAHGGPIANGYDAPLELTCKKKDTSKDSTDSKNNNTPSSTNTNTNNPAERTLLKVPNLMSLKT